MRLVGSRIGSLQVTSLLGQGGMGEVYAGFDEKLQREVALKVLHGDRLDSGTRARLLREARVLSQLSHPHICAIYDLVEHDRGELLVLERIRGTNLREALREGIEPALQLRIADQIAEALAAAHARGIVHRDLKLANVMLTEGDRQVKVLDFGLARTSREGEPSGEPEIAAAPAGLPDGEWTICLHDDGLTELGSVVGTAACMSPEQARGETVTTASDVYSLGLLLQELFTGKPPYDPHLPFHVLLIKAREGDTLPATAIGHDLAVLIQRMKALAPDERPTMADVRRRLAWIRDKPRRRARRMAAGLVALLLAAGTVKYVVDVRRERDRAVAAQAEAERARAEAEEVARFLEGVFQVSDPRSGQGGEVRARELLDRGAERVRTDLRDQPLVRARLMGVIGRIDLQLGLFKEAEPLFAEALAVRERQLGPESLEVAESLHDLGRVRLLQSRRDAEPLLRRAVALRETILPPDDPAVAEALQTLGTFLSRILVSEEAGPVLHRALKIRESRPPGPELASAVYELAVVERRNPAVAEALFRRALALRQSIFPPDHPDVITSIVALGALFGNNGRCLEALPLYEKALRLQEKRLGPGHPLTALTLSNLGACYMEAGRLAAAERVLLQALAIREKTFGRDHAELILPLRHLADVYRQEGRRREMEVMVARGLAIADRAFRPGNAQSKALRAILSEAR